MLTPEKLHLLIGYCTASLCLYRPINDNLKYVGKNSGEIMRSIALGRPVISTNQESFKFIETKKIGYLINNKNEIHVAVQKIVQEEKNLKSNCLKSYHEDLNFETYWNHFIIKSKILD